jgi:hypothetical protein
MTFDLRRAQSLVDTIPEVKESIPYLTQLANGANPEIPGYLALGKLQQINALAAGAGAAKPPQGTIKDKLTQSNGIMALMGGRGAQAAQQSQAQSMAQPGPVPQGIPQPAEQELSQDEMTGMADGGITSAEIDPRRFSFDDGGIVSFAKGSKKPVEEKEEEKTSTLGNMWRDIISSISEPMSQVGDSVIRAGQAFGTSPGLLEELTPSQRAAKERAAEEIRNPTPPPRQLSPEEVKKQDEQARLRASHELARATGNSSDSKVSYAPVISPAFQQILDARPPERKPPPGGITNVRPPAPAVNTLPAQPAMPQNEFLDMTKKFVNQAPETFDEAKETAKINARNEAAGIGTYAKVMREQQENLRKQFENSRPSMNEGIVGALRAYSRPGARAGDVGGEITNQMRDEREARMGFEQEQFKVTEAIEKLEEARRSGNVDKIAAAEAAVQKANADLRNHQMTAAASAASTLGHTQSTMAQIASHEKIEAVKAGLEKLKIAAMNKEPQAVRVMHEVEGLLAQGKTKEAEAKLKLFADVNAATQGAKYQGKNTAATPAQVSAEITRRLRAVNGMDMLDRRSKDPAKRAKAEANIQATTDAVIREMQAGGGGGGGGGQPTLAEFMAKAKPANPNASDAELKAYYQQNYGK